MYRHGQVGWVILIFVGAFAVLLLTVAFAVPGQALLLLPSLVLLLVAVLFGSLSVSVTERAIDIRFGVGLIRKRLDIAEIASCQPVRNQWWFGWGIRWIGPRRWLFNVSGLDAVELTMKNGRVYRIGTDEPDRLAQAIAGKLQPAR